MVVNQIMDKKEYTKYLQSDHWKEIAARAKEKANHVCQYCRATDVTLYTHHLRYDNIGDESPADLLVVCKKCHIKLHSGLTFKGRYCKCLSASEYEANENGKPYHIFIFQDARRTKWCVFDYSRKRFHRANNVAKNPDALWKVSGWMYYSFPKNSNEARHNGRLALYLDDLRKERDGEQE